MATENIINRMAGLQNIHFLVTHDGVFHADEVTSVTLIRMLYHAKCLEPPTLLRTRRSVHMENPTNMLVDVGGEYDPDKGRFDHHFNGSPMYPGTEWKMSSAGMIWELLGRELIYELFHDVLPSEGDQLLVFERFRRTFVIPIDLADNGQAKYGDQPVTTFSALISAMNPAGLYASSKERDEAFMAAVEWTTTAIQAMLENLSENVRQRQTTLDAMEKQLGNEILVLDQGGPWIGIATESDDAFVRYGGYRICVYPDSAREGEWKIQSFPGSMINKFLIRCPAPENLMQRKGDCEIDWVFVHPNRFIGGIRGDKEHAIAAAREWIKG